MISTYDEFVTAVAERLEMTTTQLEDKYGDMIADIWEMEQGSETSVDTCVQLCHADDQEYNQNN